MAKYNRRRDDPSGILSALESYLGNAVKAHEMLLEAERLVERSCIRRMGAQMHMGRLMATIKEVDAKYQKVAERLRDNPALKPLPADEVLCRAADIFEKLKPAAANAQPGRTRNSSAQPKTSFN